MTSFMIGPRYGTSKIHTHFHINRFFNFLLKIIIHEHASNDAKTMLPSQFNYLLSISIIKMSFYALIFHFKV
jgi:hypothetical protein